jgi:hypothetical protein
MWKDKTNDTIGILLSTATCCAAQPQKAAEARANLLTRMEMLHNETMKVFAFEEHIVRLWFHSLVPLDSCAPGAAICLLQPLQGTGAGLLLRSSCMLDD